MKRHRQEYVLEHAVSSCSASSSHQASPGQQPALPPASAESLAIQVKDLDADRLHGAIEKVLHTWDVPVASGTPAAVVSSVAQAHGQGQPVLDVLAAKAAAFRLELKKASRAQVASALWLWHHFAVHVLGYKTAVTLVGQR